MRKSKKQHLYVCDERSEYHGSSKLCFGEYEIRFISSKVVKACRIDVKLKKKSWFESK